MSNKRKHRPAGTADRPRSFLDWLMLIPLMIPLAVIPLIMYQYIYDSGYEGYAWFTYDGTQADFFLFYKQWAFVGVAAVMVVFLIIRAIASRRSMKWTPALVPLGIYALLALISTLVSEYRSFGLSGAFEQFENVFCLIGYAVVVYYAFLFVKDETDLKIVLTALSFGILIMSLIGMFQTFGLDLFGTDFGKKLFLPKSEWENLDAYQLTFEKGMAYVTLYNPNYVGVYASLVMPVTVSLILYVKPVWLKALNGANLILTAITLYGSRSKAGLIGVGVVIVLLIIFFRRLLLKWLYLTIIVVIAGVVGLVAFGRDTIIGVLQSALTISPDSPDVTYVGTLDDEIAITYRGNTIHISIDADYGFNGFSITDDAGAEVAYILGEDKETYLITDERFDGFVLFPFSFEGATAFGVNINNHNWYFTNQSGDSTYYYITAYGRTDKIVMAEEAIFSDYESFATGRGYLWSRTIPLLKDTILLGTGADTFVQVFPQQDYVGKVNNSFDTQVITKPHCMYLQIGVQTGVLSLIAFLVFYAIYFFQSLRLYLGGRFESFAAQAGVGIFIGTVGYMVCGISNDSMITVSPVFWTLIGIGFAANALARKNASARKAEAQENAA